MDSMVNIVRYMHIKMLQKMEFLQAISLMICAKYCKKSDHDENISVQSSWKFIVKPD